MRTATNGLMAASGEVINTHDQYEASYFSAIRSIWNSHVLTQQVFNDPLAVSVYDFSDLV